MVSIIISVFYLAIVIQVEGKSTFLHEELQSDMAFRSRVKRAYDTSACDQKYLTLTRNHTMCLVDVGTAGPTLTDADKQAVVDAHNNYRKNVDPSATNMLKAIWDDDMAVIAAKWARQCKVGHDKSENRVVPELPGVYIGQNMAAGRASLVASVNGWHSEVSNFKYGDGAIDVSKAIGHYTQVVNANVARIGCGAANCPNSKYKKFYICNYAIGQIGSIRKPYKKGTSCDQCKSSCSAGKLCDCGGKVCFNGGVLDKNTCKCRCASKYFSGDTCETITCPSAVSKMCALYDEDACTKYSNIPSMCPLMCGVCGTLPCNGKICRHWGDLNLDTCKCTCQPNYSGDTCQSLDCEKADPPSCSSSWSVDSCMYVNVKYECPHMCGKC